MSDQHFLALMQGMEEGLRWARGEQVPGLRVHLPPSEDAAAAREQTSAEGTVT